VVVVLFVVLFVVVDLGQVGDVPVVLGEGQQQLVHSLRRPDRYVVPCSKQRQLVCQARPAR
jgi:hypothetical protein